MGSTLLNIRIDCAPHLLTKLHVDDDVLHSKEATTQGGPSCYAMYVFATIPFIRKLHCKFREVSQVWYADDVSAAAKIVRLHEWWVHLEEGSRFNYFTNATKTCLVTREKHLATATVSFVNTGIQVTSECRPYLGAAIGSEEFVISHVKNRIESG